ncbi:hypothetical protein [Streptomyces kanamyceticus]|uniref:hypothetical protein n=1 Tax=Streptomyces kanamyceticus TaxID=1967 RepID=UPI0012FEE368|nr:hypothetical protein [Streptomyces kanamyceticus]
MITVPAGRSRTRERLGTERCIAPPVGGNTPRDRIPFDLTRDDPTTAHAAEESPG